MDAGMHHHAAQLCVGLSGPLRLRSGEDLKWGEHQGFYVPPDEPHEFIATATSTAIVYFEAESAEFAALQAPSQGAAAIRAAAPSPRSATIEALRQLAATGGSTGQADAIWLAWLGLTEAAKQPRKPDPSIVDSRALIGTRLDQPMRRSALATALNISPSWLSNQFTEQIGMRVRRYVLR
ncbi:hypothetical protein [Limnobacter sp.]|uniref:hypothetical protein n=1 Tax=Limnobacter sp. TaxID=2003368 RepID=UPI00273425A9|nr:hypothetical protein [Limnobacter sp.]MDP3271256.1 hypothetical protein [Limnobacter sp.]